MTNGAARPPGHIEMSVGDEYTIELPGLGTAGYLWSDDIEGAADVVDVEWRRGLPPSTEPRPIGGSTPEVAIVQAKTPGRVKLHLEQRRPWQADSPPAASHEVEVVVRE